MAGVEDRGQAHTGGEGHDEDAVHFVIDDVAGLAKVDWVDDLVVAVIFVAVEVFGLAAVTCGGERDVRSCDERKGDVRGAKRGREDKGIRNTPE